MNKAGSLYAAAGKLVCRTGGVESFELVVVALIFACLLFQERRVLYVGCPRLFEEASFEGKGSSNFLLDIDGRFERYFTQTSLRSTTCLITTFTRKVAAKITCHS